MAQNLYNSYFYNNRTINNRSWELIEISSNKRRSTSRRFMCFGVSLSDPQTATSLQHTQSNDIVEKLSPIAYETLR